MKIMAITDMEAPATIKDVQKLTGCMAALNKFISRLGERGLPFFKLLKCQDKVPMDGGGRAGPARSETSPSVYGDSLLVVQQVNKEWDCNKETMDAYVQEVRKLENKFSGLEIHHVVREHNIGADILSKLGSTRAQVPVGVFIQELKQPSIKSSTQITTDSGLQQPGREVMLLEEDWREAYIDFIRDQKLPVGVDARSEEAARAIRRSKGFVLVDSKLYQRGARSGVLMKCVTKEDGCDILREIHEGVCGNHAASRTLVGKAYRACFWRPTAVSDAEDLVRRCQNCQFFGKQSHVPAHSLITIPSSRKDERHDN
jgi:hypothetical protein